MVGVQLKTPFLSKPEAGGALLTTKVAPVGKLLMFDDRVTLPSSGSLACHCKLIGVPAHTCVCHIALVLTFIDWLLHGKITHCISRHTEPISTPLRYSSILTATTGRCGPLGVKAMSPVWVLKLKAVVLKGLDVLKPPA